MWNKRFAVAIFIIGLMLALASGVSAARRGDRGDNGGNPQVGENQPGDQGDQSPEGKARRKADEQGAERKADQGAPQWGRPMRETPAVDRNDRNRQMDRPGRMEPGDQKKDRGDDRMNRGERPQNPPDQTPPMIDHPRPEKNRNSDIEKAKRPRVQPVMPEDAQRPKRPARDNVGEMTPRKHDNPPAPETVNPTAPTRQQREVMRQTPAPITERPGKENPVAERQPRGDERRRDGEMNRNRDEGRPPREGGIPVQVTARERDRNDGRNDKNWDRKGDNDKGRDRDKNWERERDNDRRRYHESERNWGHNNDRWREYNKQHWRHNDVEFHNYYRPVYVQDDWHHRHPYRPAYYYDSPPVPYYRYHNRFYFTIAAFVPVIYAPYVPVYVDRPVVYRTYRLCEYRRESYYVYPWYSTYYYTTSPAWNTAYGYAPGFSWGVASEVNSGSWSANFTYGYGGGIRLGVTPFVYSWYPYSGYNVINTPDSVPDDYTEYVAGDYDVQ